MPIREQASSNNSIYSDATEVSEHIIWNVMVSNHAFECEAYLRNLNETESVATENNFMYRFHLLGCIKFSLYAHKALTRGQDTREATMKMMFEDRLPGVGPDPAVHIGFVSNEGKANPVRI